MTVTETSRLLLQSQQLKKQDAAPTLPNGSLPPKGHVNPFEDPYMNLTGKSPSEWQKLVPVDDGVADQLRSLVREDFVKRNGMCGWGEQANAYATIVKGYIATLPGEQRLAASYSCQQVGDEEANRIVAKIREHNPSWQFGQSFDTSILDDLPKKGLNRQA